MNDNAGMAPWWENPWDPEPTVPCKWCGKETRMLGTKMCDACWELDSRIRMDKVLARKILEHYEEE